MSIVSRTKTVISTFLPTSIDGCVLWLDGADPAGTGTAPANGTTVSTWVDKSINGYNATQAGGSLTYSSANQGIVFNGASNSYYTVSSATFPTGNTYYSIFLVVQTSLPAGHYSHMFSSGANVGGQAIDIPIYPTGAVETGWWTTNILSAGGVVTANTKIILATTYDSTGLYLYGNGTSIASSTILGTRNGVSTVGYVGCPPGGPNMSGASFADQNFIGTMHEALLFSGLITESQRKQIEGYLAQKWGLTSQLPPGHPGLTQTFYGTGKSTVVVPIRLLPFNIYTNYNPLTATGSTCILWLDASDPTTLFSDAAGTTLASVNGTVGYWRDKSSSGFNCTQATLSYRPTYVAAAKNGRSILSFNGLTNFLNLPQFTAVPLTIFFVAQGTVFIPNTFFLSLGSTGSTVMMRMIYSPQYYGVDGTSSLLISTTNADTNWHLWTLTISSSTATFYFDGTLVGTSSWANGSAYTFATNTIASWNQQVGGQATTLRIPEILFYSAVLGTTQQRQVESYLTEKWGLVSQPTRGVASIVAVPKFITVTATGGTITFATISGINYRIHSFTTVGTANFTLTSPGSITATVLVVAGGGAGGYDDGGGGGAGGVIYNAAFTITSGSYTVTVGNGGTSNGASGANSVLSSLTAIGGGGGANGNGSGSSGGSGGGLGWGNGTGATPGSGTAGQGNTGGGGTGTPNFCAGGGGGAGGVGGTGSGITPGNGGIGVSYTIAGTTYNVGGGGGGGLAVQNSTGTNSTASFGGGNGAGHGANAAVAGTPNTGGGGGGSNNELATNGAFGGSGIVIIAYRWQ